MTRRGIPTEEGARRLGVPVSTFRAWLTGRNLPTVGIFGYWGGLADLAGISESELLVVAGVASNQFAGAVSLAQATRDLREGLERTRASLSQAAVLTQSSAVAQVVNELSMSGVNWEIRLRSAHRGEAFRVTYHHYVGLVPPTEFDSWTVDQIKRWVQHDLLAHVWVPLSLYWRVAELHDWSNAPALVIQVAEQEASRPPAAAGPMRGAGSVVVVSPPWGYGELLASLVADAIGFGNIDFRYRGIPDEGPNRLATAQGDLDTIDRDHVISIPPLMLVEGLRLGRTQLDERTIVRVTYGERIGERAAVVYADALTTLCGSAEAGMRRAADLVTQAFDELPGDYPYLAVHIADDDVELDGVIDRHRLNDTVARLALAVSETILSDHGLPPVPVGGPLREYFRSAGRPGSGTVMVSTVVRSAAGRAAPGSG